MFKTIENRVFATLNSPSSAYGTSLTTVTANVESAVVDISHPLTDRSFTISGLDINEADATTYCIRIYSGPDGDRTLIGKYTFAELGSSIIPTSLPILSNNTPIALSLESPNIGGTSLKCNVYFTYFKNAYEQ